MLAAKIHDYPWTRPELQRASKYALLAGSAGTNAARFWEYYTESAPTEEFKNFIESMLAHLPSSRPTMADILGHPWMTGPVITKEEFAAMCEGFL